MKHLILGLLLLTNTAAAQLKNGDKVPDFAFKTLLNAPLSQTQLSALKGKIVMLEFWATWCGACLEAMPHLDQLQKKYKQQLQVIMVTDETSSRTAGFLTARPSGLWFAIDTGRIIARIFPHQMIPHTVLISPEGKLVANTSPEAVTAAVIDSLLAQKTVQLPEKKDKLMSHEEVLQTWFFLADTVKSSFVMQPAMAGLPGMSTTYLDQPVFKNRRITCINVDLKMLYQIAYRNTSYRRLIDKIPKEQTPGYCLDLLVPQEKDLLPRMQAALSERFDLKAKKEIQAREVYVLKVADQEKFKKIPVHRSGNRTYAASHGEIDQKAISMADFAEYLETYGTGKLAVVEETGSAELFDIKFSFQPENPQSLTTVLGQMGLILTKETRSIEMLVLYK